MYIVKDEHGFFLAVAHIGNKFNLSVQSPYWVKDEKTAEHFYLKKEAKDYCTRNKIFNCEFLKTT